MNLLLRIVASPFLLGLILIRYNLAGLQQITLFLKYGGEWINYSKKDEIKTVQQIYNKLKEHEKI